MVRSRRGRVVKGGLLTLGLAVLLLWTTGPVIWVLLTAFKNSTEIYAYPPSFLPHPPTLANFVDLFTHTAFAEYMRNSTIVAVGVTAASLVLAALGAYPIARMQFRGRAWVARTIVVAYLLPPSLLFIPLFVVLETLGLIDTKPGLMLAHLTFTMPFCTWMLIGYYRSIPVALDEAARIDGASHLQTLTRVVLPVALPGLCVVALFAFTNSWNDFLYALVYTQSDSSKTITSGIAQLIMGDVLVWGQMMAASVAAILPVLIIYIIAQRTLVEGLAAGSVKQ
jgi:ABC-type glycerol-3-phosphate transport system permease component